MKKTNVDILWSLFLRKLLLRSASTIMITGWRGNIVFANEAFYDRFALSKKNIIGEKWFDSIVSKDFSGRAKAIFRRLKKKNTACKLGVASYFGGGLKGTMCWTCIPIKNDKARFYMFIGRPERVPEPYEAKFFNEIPAGMSSVRGDIIDMLFSTLATSEPETGEHATRVMSLVGPLAKKLGVNKKGIERLKEAALLHDLGKLAVDEGILFKKGKLTKGEYAKIKKHPHWGADLARLIYFLHDIIPIMEDHHENYDGTGYPAGIKGKDIPFEARILTVADVFEALTADRSYRKGFPRDKALAIMADEKGKKFDPKVLDTFFGMMKKKDGGRCWF